jgi:NAD(P)-dependent dehydrogenase (short-subunit alcohol dehydrogenase family)
MRLKDKVCLITGGGSGIGRAAALLFAREGATVAVADKDAGAAEAVASSLDRGLALRADVSEEAEVAEMVRRTLHAFGRLDVLVNNAGYGFAATVVDTAVDDFDALMAVNVRGVFLGCKHAIPAMRQAGGGVIVNVASVASLVAIRNRAAYVTSKGAVVALTRAVALDHVKEGIRCNAVAPGTIDTPYYGPILARSADPGLYRKELEARQPMGRMGTAEEIADAILFLASDESRFATGTILTIDGGWSAQ